MIARSARLVAVAVVAVLGSGCSTTSCKAIGLSSQVRVEVPADWIGRQFRLCADDECRDGLAAIADARGALVGFSPTKPIARSVHVALIGTEPATPTAEATIRTHAIYPGCQEAPVAAARLDPATGRLVVSEWVWANGKA
jgi:hypothetical protein